MTSYHSISPLQTKLISTAITFTTLIFLHQTALAAPPVIEPIQDRSIAQGNQLVVPVTLANANEAGTVNWSKAYGPDDVHVNPFTGAVTWAVPSDMPTESFHVGVRASNLEGSNIDSFIVHAGVTKIVFVGPNEEVKNFADAFTAYRSPGRELRDPGTTFVVRNGTYSGSDWVIGLTGPGNLQNLAAGTASKYNTVMAEDPGQVILTGYTSIFGRGDMGTVAYWAIKGFYLEGGYLGVDGTNCQGDISCEPHHVKFIRNGLYNLPASSSLGAAHSHYILFENNYSFGGQRVKFLTYKASKIIFRRNVGRFDYNDVTSNPKNTFSFYTSMDIAAQNNLALDADSSEFVSSGQLAGEFGCPTTAGDSRAVWDRNIQLNSDMLHANLDLQNGKCYSTINDVVGWDNRSPYNFIMSRSPSLFNHATFGQIALIAPDVIFNGWPSDHARGFTNSIIHDVAAGPMFEGFQTGTTPDADDNPMNRYGIDTVNISGFDGTIVRKDTTVNNDTLTAYDPMWSSSNPNGGLRYLIRIEANSNLSGKAQDGGDLGATIMTFKGKSGTLWGEEGYDQETNHKAWPFPFQEVIAEKMRSMRYTGPTWVGEWGNRSNGPEATLSGDRGFARADTNIADYIWGYLGSTVPPMNVNATGTPKSAVIRWDPPAARANINSYKVYDYDPETQAISNPRNAGNSNSITISNLNNGESYYYAVTAVDDTTGESSWSYPVEVIPQERPKPLPPQIIGG